MIYQRVRLSVVHDDLTKSETDAIVNAANGNLSHGGGVAGAISRNGGPKVQIESTQYINKYGTIPDGGTAVTSGADLPCKYIIHAVGPVWINGKSKEKEKLEMAVKNSLDEANKRKLKSIAIPAISSGIFGFPKDLCAKILISESLQFIDDNIKNISLSNVLFTNFDSKTVYHIYNNYY